MVEVDPNILLIGTVVVGIALIFSCLRTNNNKKEVKKTEVVAEVAAPVTVASKPKRKSKSKSKSKSATSSAEASKPVVSEVASVPVATPSVKPVVVEVAVEEDASDDDEEERLTPEIFKPTEVTKSKKTKETQEQKIARLEREKVKKETKKVLEEESIYAASALSHQNDFQAHSQASHPSYDGWAVVEGRKLKVKRNESTNDLDEVPTLLATPPAPVTTAPAVAVEEVQTPPPAPIDSVTKQLTVEARKLGLLIGPKGVTKIGLQNATGTDIAMPKVEKDFTGPVEISITGTNEGVDRAIFALNEMVVKGYSTILASPDFHEGYVEVKPKFLPDIIGKAGASIKAIQLHTGVKISTPSGYTKTSPSGETIVPSKVKIVLAGSKDKVAIARGLILDLTKYFHTPVTHPGLVHAELEIPSNYFNYIIGSKGSEIKHIQANYKVTVYIPGAESLHENLLIVGEEAAVQNAEKHIRRLIEKVDTQAAERAKVEAEGAALGENARARFAAGTAGNAEREPRSNSRGARAPRADGAAAPEGRSRSAKGGAAATAESPKDEDRQEEWMNEFAPRRAPINLGGMLPASAKFAAAPPALPAPVSAAEEAAPVDLLAPKVW